MPQNIFKIFDGRTNFWQWDTGQKLIVLDDSITEVHFSNRDMNHSIQRNVYELNGQRVVNIPDTYTIDGITYNTVIIPYVYLYGYDETTGTDYDLEYGTDSLEIHKDAIKKGQKVVIIDDLMATGGTMGAIVKLVERLGGEVVKIICMVDLPELGCKDKFKNYDYSYIVKYMEDEK